MVKVGIGLQDMNEHRSPGEFLLSHQCTLNITTNDSLERPLLLQVETIGSNEGQAYPTSSLSKYALAMKESAHRHLGQNRWVRGILRRRLEHCNLPRPIRIQRQDARCVLVAVAVVGSRPDRHELLVEEVLVTFHHKLVSTRYES